MKGFFIQAGRFFFAVSLFLSLFLPGPARARMDSNSAIIFRPSLDGSQYFSTEQSRGLYQWGYHLGLGLNYAFEPVELALGSGRLAGVVDDLLVAHFTAAVGLTDWLNAGLDVPVAVYERYFNFINLGTTCSANNIPGCPGETKTKMGDVLFAFKVRLLNSDLYPVGISVQPFVMLPTGSGFYNTGYGNFTGGGKLILDAHIRRKVYFALNVGYHVVPEATYARAITVSNAKINDQLLFSGAVNVPVGKDFGIIGEIFGQTLLESPFKHEIQTPVAFLGGLRYSPGLIKRWAFTAGGGLGLDQGFGSPGFQAYAQVAYRKSKVVELGERGPEAVEAPFEEKIVIMQKIHFAFDRWDIRPISFPILDDVVRVLQQNPQIGRVRIEGHTDWLGSDAYNNRLSMRRADSVRQYLIRKGIDPNRLIAAGYGEQRPIADNNSELGRAKNRRTEFVVMESR